MLAVNPKTGKPIQIMKTETVITKTKRTLLWHSPSFQGNHDKWNRVSVIVTEHESLAHIPNPQIVFIAPFLNDSAYKAWGEWLNKKPTNALIISNINTIQKINFVPNDKYSILLMDDITLRYPYLEPLSETASTELWVLKIAQLMRFHVLITHTPIENFSIIPYTGTITLIEKTSTPESVLPQIYLIQQYFIPDKTKRIREIRSTLKQNIDCKHIDKIILLNEQIYSDVPDIDKIQQVVIGKRLTYMDVFKYAKQNLPSNSFVVFSNSDIYLDETINNLYNIDMEKKFLSLLRYDTTSDGEPPKLFGPRPDSQDTWIFKNDSIDFEPTQEDFGFHFGIPGCDNAINISMFKKRFLVANPALTIKTYHNQESQIRTYNRSDVIDKPMFLYVSPTAIQDYNPLKDFEQARDKAWVQCKNKSFSRRIRYVNKETVKGLLANLNMKPGYNYNLDSDNIYNMGIESNENVLYTFNEPKFVMPCGVISDYKNLYLGKNDIWLQEWKNVTASILTQTIMVPEMCATHYPETLTAQKWFTYYLPECLSIYEYTKSKPLCIMHPKPEVETLLKLLINSEDESIRFIQYNKDIQYYSNKVYLLSPKKTTEASMENMRRLRKFLPITNTGIKQKRLQVVLISDSTNKLINDDFVEKVYSDIFKNTNDSIWDVTILTNNSPYEKRFKSLMKADLLIGPAKSEWDSLDWLWLMKSDSTVVEIMDQMKPSGEHIHLAGACNINYVLLAIKPEPVTNQIQNLMNNIELVLKEQIKSDVSKAKISNTTVITMPTSSAMAGLYHHSGDTFREMVDIWKERQYCTVEYSESSPHVWWGKIGDTLLYDRPTMRWLNSPSYKLALFGNSMPENPAPNQRPWSFWPRSPKQVEIIANQSSLTYSERTYKSIFIGKIENGVQMANRTKADWKSVIEKFYMPIDSTGGPYKYSQQEYLSLLSQSLYGLCLPGYGPKCNREIEYFATGTIPIISPGVDIVNYANAPIEGVHYFSANTPEQVTEIINNTTPEKWSEMSSQCRLWWKENASAEGLFNVTMSLVKTYNGV